ncbi:MAG TPA: hypothetical protein VGG65_06395 [Thermoanaerobaculia bacterium]
MHKLRVFIVASIAAASAVASQARVYAHPFDGSSSDRPDGHGPTYAPPTCAGVFSDVACPSLFADWIHHRRVLWTSKGVNR